jgi:hypothetical protein
MEISENSPFSFDNTSPEMQATSYMRLTIIFLSKAFFHGNSGVFSVASHSRQVENILFLF